MTMTQHKYKIDTAPHWSCWQYYVYRRAWWGGWSLYKGVDRIEDGDRIIADALKLPIYY
jgi:hypothetical protein